MVDHIEVAFRADPSLDGTHEKDEVRDDGTPVLRRLYVGY